MKLYLLIVDDEEAICQFLKSFFELDANYEVSVATDPVEALEIIKSRIVHIVLSDIMMPGIDGVELLEEIKKLDGLVQVIMMTAYSTVERVIKCIRNGATDYIMKPFDDIEEVKTIVDDTARKIKRWKELVVKSGELSSIADGV